MGTLLSFTQFFLKFCFYLFIVLLIFFAIFVIMVLNFDVNNHKAAIMQAFNRETGLELLLKGPIQTDLFPEPTAHLSRVEIINRTKDSKLKLTIEDVQLTLNPFTLFADIIQISQINARGLNITLTEGKTEKLNFDIDTFSGQIHSSFREIRIPSFILKSGNNEVVGSFKMMTLANIPVVNGDFTSRQFNFEIKPDKNVQDTKVFSSKNIALDWFNNLNGQLNWHFDNLFIGNLSIEDTDLQLSFKDKVLDMTPRGKVAGGDLTGKIQVRKRDNGFQITTKLQLKNAIASEFFQQFWKNAALLNGKLDIRFDGKSRGGDLATWMSHLTGRGLISIKNMQIQDRDIDTRYIDVFAALWKSLTPSKKGTSLECVAILLNAEDGQVRAPETIGMQTGDMYALGGGSVDLKNETVDLSFDLYPRSQINIEIGSLDQVVHVKGTLSQPELVKSPKGMIKEGGTLLLGVATGGLSILAEKMLKIVSQKSSPCQQVLAEAFEETND